MELFLEYESLQDKKDTIYVFRQDSSSTPLHFHNAAELIYVLEGELEAVIDGQVCHPRAGDLIMIGSLAPHTIEPLTDYSYYCAILPPSRIPEWRDRLHRMSFSKPVQSDDPAGTIRQLFELMHGICRDKELYPPESRQEPIRHLAAVLLDRVVRCCPLTEQPRSTTLISDTVRIIQQNHTKKLLVSDIAHTLGCNAQQLSERFRAIMKISIPDYITVLRLQTVIRLLNERRDALLSEIAEESGFGSTRSMLRAFGEQYGMSPSEYRKTLR